MSQEALPASPPAPVVPGRNGYATASLSLAIFGFTGIPGLLGVIFGIVALVQLRRTRQAGRGFAITGIVLSVLWLAGAVFWIFDELDDPPGSYGLYALQKGDCFVEAVPTGTNATKVSCTEAHDAEVIGTVALAGDAYPGDNQVSSQAALDCNRQAVHFFDKKIAPGVYTIPQIPSERAWDHGVRTAMCLAFGSSGRLSQPVRDLIR
ncbi:DUF4190 domain-containing protein [Amycolatopsis sp. NPDC059021]|uniref:DUF4190 domain-containing protein n=1 Tax=Amycolatopsis sp. NPDC059021 TaxID=3346704 RepID=UPI00366CFF2A